MAGLVDTAFHERITIGADESLDVVTIQRVAAEADGIGDDLVAQDMVLGHDLFADHATCFPDIDLPGPVSVVGELVFRVTPSGELLANLSGDAFVREEEVEEAFLVADVFGDDAIAGAVVAFDVAVIAAEVVDAERTEVIEVGLAIRHRIVEPEGMIEAGLEVASEQFVTGGIVAFRALDRNTVFRDIREESRKL